MDGWILHWNVYSTSEYRKPTVRVCQNVERKRVWSVLVGVYQSSEFYRRPFERTRLQKDGKINLSYTEMNRSAASYIAKAHLWPISDVHTEWSIHHRNLFRSHAHSLARTQTQMAWQAESRSPLRYRFPRKCSLSSEPFVSCLHARALSVCLICTAMCWQCGEILARSAWRSQESIAHKRDGTDTETHPLSLSLSFPLSRAHTVTHLQ